MNVLPLGELFAELTRDGSLTRLVESAYAEDVGTGDVTSAACIDAGQVMQARIATRSAGVCAGMSAVPSVLTRFAPHASLQTLVRDGSRIARGEVLGLLTGPAREILLAERTILNLLGRLCGVATTTSLYVQAARAGGPAAVLDTRKTTPGWRSLEKYAVRCGGGACHRLGLFDAALFKDNHLAGVAVADLANWATSASARARASAGPAGLRFVELEVDSLDQLRAILDAGGCGIDIVLLDNMDPERLREAVGLRNASATRLLLEASGGITLESIPRVAATGVDRISTGALTHSSVWLDIGLDAE